MTATTDTPSTADSDFLRAGGVNARGEPVFLKGQGFELTARQIVLCLAAHLTRFGDTLTGPHVDAPLWAIDAHMRFDGDLTYWSVGRSPREVAMALARAEQIAAAYFGHRFPALTW